MSTQIRKPTVKSGDTFVSVQNAMKSGKWDNMMSIFSKSEGGRQAFLEQVKSRSIRDLQSNNNVLAQAVETLYDINTDWDNCRKFSASPAGRSVANYLISKLSGGQQQLYGEETTEYVKTAFEAWLKNLR